MTAAVVAAVSLGMALACLAGGPRTAALRDAAQPAAAMLPLRQRAAAAAQCWDRPAPCRRLACGWACSPAWWSGWRSARCARRDSGVAAVPATMVLLHWAQTEPDRRRRRALVAQLPGCLDLLAAALDAGVPLRAAVAHVAELAPEPSAGLLRGVLAHLEIGRSDAQAWSTLRADPVWGGPARDLARCADSGAAIAAVLSVHAADARARRRAQREAVARTTGVRSVLPLVCCFLPAFVLVGVVPIVAATLGSFTW